jgi:hypothetical protein
MRRAILSFAVSFVLGLKYTATRKVVEPRRFVKRHGSEAQDISFSRELFNVFMPPAPFIIYFFDGGFGISEHTLNFITPMPIRT